MAEAEKVGEEEWAAKAEWSAMADHGGLAGQGFILIAKRETLKWINKEHMS